MIGGGNKFLVQLGRAWPAATIFFTGCGSRWQSTTDPAGPQSSQINGLWWLMFYVCSVVFVLVMVFTLVAIRRRQANSERAEIPADVELNPPAESENRKRNVVVAGALLTIVVLFVFMVDSFFVGRGLTAELARKQGVTIEITGHQWWWEARYLNVDASSIFTTANEIHVPVGVPVTFSLRSTDVIHSFWVPNLSGKKDLIPGKIATIWFQADRPGVFRGQCAEYCGHQHAHMGLWVMAEPLEQFQAWQRNQIQSAVAPATASEQRGQAVFLTSACVMCHAINGTAAGSNIGPNLTHIGNRSTIAAATLANTRDHLSQWITNSQQIKPGNRMPPNSLAPDDLQALLDYLESLK
jgi:cytochrome c oxidase subunit 2